jgi:hypothetical protein
MNTYDVVLAFLKREFGEDATAVRTFYGYLTNKVKLIRIQTEDVAKALKIFETINDRGVGLDSMDLLKNLLFQKADRKQFEELKGLWKVLQDTLFEIGEKPLRFLRYFVLSRYDVEILREDEIYAWFRKNEKLCGYAEAPLKFAKELLEVARAYRNFLEANDKKGVKNRYLENMRLLGGSAARQHLILLLAGRDLPASLFDGLCREVENLFFCYVVTREPTRDFERNFASWAKEVRSAKSEEALNVFFSKRFESAKIELAARFKDAFDRMTADSLQGYRLRYMLAKFTQSIELAAFGETEGTRWLSRFTGGGFEVEHIFPQRPSEKANKEFGPYKNPLVATQLGNLVLVEKSINASLGNRAYSEKKNVYRESQLLLTRALAEKPKIGKNTKIDAAVSQLEPFPTWNEASIGVRQSQLIKLAHEIWNVPSPKR